MGRFWSAALGWPLVWDQDEETAIRAPHGGPKITWGGPPLMPRIGRRRVGFDLAAVGDVADELDRLRSLGAVVCGPAGRAATRWTTLTDPDGNEFRLRTA